ncbi:MAG: serine/threonine-protein kinase [Acidianus infernus]|nr:serine/threonine-protein kinase [Acidianus infernus]
MRINEKIVNTIRLSFIASSILVGFIILYPMINDISLFSSNSIIFIVTESLIIYALAMSIKPCLKSIGIALVLSNLLIPSLLQQTFSSMLSNISISIFFYITFIILTLIMLLIALLFGGTKLQIIYLIITAFILLPILQYSILNIRCYSCIFKYLPYSILFYNHMFLFYTVSGILGFVLSASKKAERLVFDAVNNVALPYFLSALLPLIFLLLILNNVSTLKEIIYYYIVNHFATYLILVMIAVSVFGSIIFRGQRDTEFAIVISLASLGLAWFSFIYSPYYTLVFLILGASVIPISLPNPQLIENKLFSAINSNSYNKAEKYLDTLLKLNYTYTKIFCDAAGKFECNSMSWIYSKFAGKIIYNNCNNLSNVVNCIISKNIIPSDANVLLDVLVLKDKDSAEKFASYLLTKNLPQPIKEKAKLTLASIMGIASTTNPKQLPPLESWDPNIWIGNNLYGYKITKVLGSGGSSYVLVGERNSQQYAIKVAKISKSNVNDILNVFGNISKESSNLQSISEKSPNIVRIFGFFADLNSIMDIVNGKSEVYYFTPPAIVMELMEGGTVEDLLKNKAIVLSNYWKKVVALISLNIANALKVVHQEGYVHLDVKPSNIFFNKYPGKTAEEIYENIRNGVISVKLGDLGSARKIGERVLEYTPQYCSIDQVEAMLTNKGADVRMDVYALGATIYKMLTQTQFNPPKVSELMDKAVQAYVKNQPYAIYLEEARKELEIFHQRFSLPAEYAEFTPLIKTMTSPDILKRPNIDYVIMELNKLNITS